MAGLRNFMLLLFAALAGSCYAQSFRQMLSALGNPEFHGNRVELLPTANEKYDRMFKSIQEAEHFVHVEYFSVTHDSGCGVHVFVGAKGSSGSGGQAYY